MRTILEFILQFATVLALVLVVLGALTVAFPNNGVANEHVSGVLAVTAMLLLSRPVAQRLLNGALAERVLILGSGPLASTIAAGICRSGRPGCTVVGMVDDGHQGQERYDETSNVPILGSLHNFNQIIWRSRPNRIVIALFERRGRLPAKALLSQSLRGIVIEDGLAVLERITGKLAIESLTPSEIFLSTDFRKSRVLLLSRRVMSFTLSLIALVASLPVFVLAAIAIKLESRGPVFFVHPRLGYQNRPFNLLKFRTMHPWGPSTSEWEMDNRDRITRLGKWLRRYRIDELPQLINVLLGHMNLIGPRPHPVANHRLFRKELPHYALRGVIPPGITGWAQVRYGYANGLEQEREKVRFDLYYIKNMSLWLDVRILVDTVKVLFSGREQLEVRKQKRAPGQTVAGWTPALGRYGSGGRPAEHSGLVGTGH